MIVWALSGVATGPFLDPVGESAPFRRVLEAAKARHEAFGQRFLGTRKRTRP